MSEQSTQNLGNGNSFEERLMFRLDAIDARLQALEARVPEQAQEPGYDTRPILERILKEVADNSFELRAVKAELVEVKERLTRVEERQTALEERQTALEERQTALEERLAAVETQLAAVQDGVSHFGHKLDVFNEDQLKLRWAFRDFEKRLGVPEKQPA